MIKILPSFPDVVHISYPNQFMLARAFMRMQEFYESPLEGFRGHHFTRLEFKHAYAEDRETGIGYGEFTYYDDWDGFNVPGHVANKFMKLFTPDFMEDKLVRLIKRHRKPHGKYYVIGTHQEGGVMRHELSHAFWYLNPDYCEEAQGLVDELPVKFAAKMRKELQLLGYHHDVLDDEIVAYLSAGTMTEIVDILETGNIPWKKVLEFQKHLYEYIK